MIPIINESKLKNHYNAKTQAQKAYDTLYRISHGDHLVYCSDNEESDVYAIAETLAEMDAVPISHVTITPLDLDRATAHLTVTEDYLRKAGFTKRETIEGAYVNLMRLKDAFDIRSELFWQELEGIATDGWAEIDDDRIANVRLTKGGAQ